MTKEFWKDWKRITRLEETAIESLKQGRKIILDNFPKNRIYAIYVKGSFPRRELNKNSDVDLVSILVFTKDLLKMKRLDERYNRSLHPNVGFGAYSLWELRNGKRSTMAGLKKERTGTSRVLKHFENYRLIYGKHLETSDFPRRSHRHDVESMISIFHDLFIPLFQKKEQSECHLWLMLRLRNCLKVFTEMSILH